MLESLLHVHGIELRMISGPLSNGKMGVSMDG